MGGEAAGGALGRAASAAPAVASRALGRPRGLATAGLLAGGGLVGLVA